MNDRPWNYLRKFVAALEVEMVSDKSLLAWKPGNNSYAQAVLRIEDWIDDWRCGKRLPILKIAIEMLLLWICDCQPEAQNEAKTSKR